MAPLLATLPQTTTIRRMNDLLRRLRDKGNTVLVVEHEPETIEAADHVVHSGPAPARRAARSTTRGGRGVGGTGTITGRQLDDRAGLKATVRPSGVLEVRGAGTYELPGPRRVGAWLGAPEKYRSSRHPARDTLRRRARRACQTCGEVNVLACVSVACTSFHAGSCSGRSVLLGVNPALHAACLIPIGAIPRRLMVRSHTKQ